MTGSLSPLLPSGNLCEAPGCRSDATYQAACNHKLCDHDVVQIKAGGGGQLICPVNNELIANRFSLLSDLTKSCDQALIKRTIENRKAEIRCCALGVCFFVVFGVGFTYFQLR